MLYIIGVGFDVSDISLRAADVVKLCEKLYAEDYTMAYDFKALSKVIGKAITVLDRHDVEEGMHFIDEAKKSHVALLVPGDPLTATTHISLLIAAHEKGINYEVIHNQSIYSAIAETGLHIYKFGKTASILEHKQGFRPTSFYDIIKENISIGAHTLLLLEPGMTVSKTVAILLDIGKHMRKPIIKQDTMLVAAHIGTSTRIVYAKASELVKMDMKQPCCIIVPAGLHFSEKETLEKLYKKPDS